VVAPARNLAATIVLNIFICAILFDIFEEGNDGMEGSLYWAVTTATTTGYGDISPTTTAGRAVGMWLMLTSVGLVAIATAKIASALIQDPHLFSHEEQEELADDLDDSILMLVKLLEHHGIEVPDSVEEYHRKDHA
jgi:voltage-gated potassium channel